MFLRLRRRNYSVPVIHFACRHRTFFQFLEKVDVDENYRRTALGVCVSSTPGKLAPVSDNSSTSTIREAVTTPTYSHAQHDGL